LTSFFISSSPYVYVKYVLLKVSYTFDIQYYSPETSTDTAETSTDTAETSTDAPDTLSQAENAINKPKYTSI
jgi:hypothetical protein